MLSPLYPFVLVIPHSPSCNLGFKYFSTSFALNTPCSLEPPCRCIAGNGQPLLPTGADAASASSITLRPYTRSCIWQPCNCQGLCLCLRLSPSQRGLKVPSAQHSSSEVELNPDLGVGAKIPQLPHPTGEIILRHSFGTCSQSLCTNCDS